MDSQLNDLIRLKQPPPAPTERWQRLVVRERIPCSNDCATFQVGSPTCPRNASVAQPTPHTPISPSGRVCIKYKKTPKIKTPVKTPIHSCKKKSPVHSGARKKQTPGKQVQTPGGCRFIPNRSTTDLDYSAYLLTKKESKEEVSPSREEYKQSLLTTLAKNSAQKSILSFNTSSNISMGEGSFNYTVNSSHRTSMKHSYKRKAKRRLPITADKILDAPALVNDYYINTLDWGKNHLAVGLGNAVFLWNPTSGDTQMLMEMGERDYVSSVSWAANGKYLAIGGSDAAIQLWDVEKQKRLRIMTGHTNRVGVLTWNAHMLVSGGHSGQIHYHDVRQAEHCVTRSALHQLEVCGLKWTADGRYLASGGNDNLVAIWNASNPAEPMQLLQGHQASVKALAWCPWQSNLLATGGGANDRTIKFWNASTGQCLNSIDAKSQVSGIAWNKEYHELITSHGNPDNQLSIWKYPSMCKVGELCGHQDRVLNMTMNPEKTCVASAGADETLRIWNCFEHCQSTSQSQSYSEDSITALINTVH